MLIVWLLLLVSSLIVASCASSRPSSSALQKRDSTIAYNASQISDAEAAVIAYDMLMNCEKNLADSTLALQTTRKNLPKKIRQAKWQGVGMGGVGMLVAVGLLMILR